MMTKPNMEAFAEMIRVFHPDRSGSSELAESAWYGGLIDGAMTALKIIYELYTLHTPSTEHVNNVELADEVFEKNERRKADLFQRIQESGLLYLMETIEEYNA